jgi:uncharacterized membrane protein YedE/YeeE
MDETNVILEQYKLFVDSSNRVSEQRSRTNNFFVSVNVALLAIFPVLFEKMDTREQMLFGITIGAVGIFMNVIWFLAIRAHKALNSAKFKILHEMEDSLPYQPFQMEWKVLKSRKWVNKHFTLTAVEVYIPVAFALIHWAVVCKFLS